MAFKKIVDINDFIKLTSLKLQIPINEIYDKVEL